MFAQGISLSRLAWAAALIPLIATHISYVIAASAGHVEWCVPYWDSCTSISATGREMPEKLWFRSSMILAVLVTIMLWWCAALWRRRAGPSRHSLALRCMPLLGTLAGVSLTIYILALGEQGEAYRFLRRLGVVLGFAFTYMSQLLLTRLLGELARQRNELHLLRWYHRLFLLNILLLGVGILSVILDAILGTDYDRFEDAFEWIMALLLNLYFAGLAAYWGRESPLRLR